MEIGNFQWSTSKEGNNGVIMYVCHSSMHIVSQTRCLSVPCIFLLMKIHEKLKVILQTRVMLAG
jgi:hypothetical protein